MRSAVVFTAYNRPQYLHETLQAWDGVRSLHDWRLIFRIEPSPLAGVMTNIVKSFIDRNRLDDVDLIRNESVLGVLRHPLVAMTEAFEEHDFVVRAEDDLLPSADFLEFMAWARDTYQAERDVLTVCAASDLDGDLGAVRKVQDFKPWLWGSWYDRWEQTLAPTWDSDYSTYNVVPGNESGWDWNIATRIMPKQNLYGIFPVVSRVQNIGMHGVHGTPENFHPLPSWRWAVEPQTYSQSA